MEAMDLGNSTMSAGIFRQAIARRKTGLTSSAKSAQKWSGRCNSTAFFTVSPIPLPSVADMPFDPVSKAMSTGLTFWDACLPRGLGRYSRLRR